MAPAGDPDRPLPGDRDDAAVDELNPPGDRLNPPGDRLTIGELAARFGLSRSTLLYYDRIGVLSPSARSAAGYRRYDGADVDRLARICRYRRAGLPLSVITELLDQPDTDLAEVLTTRLEALNDEIRQLRSQQRFILAYLSGDRNLSATPFLTADRFVELLELAGVSAPQRAEWHAAFERTSAEEHQAFLEFLCLPDDAIERIRAGALDDRANEAVTERPRPPAGTAPGS